MTEEFFIKCQFPSKILQIVRRIVSKLKKEFLKLDSNDDKKNLQISTNDKIQVWQFWEPVGDTVLVDSNERESGLLIQSCQDEGSLEAHPPTSPAPRSFLSFLVGMMRD